MIKKLITISTIFLVSILLIIPFVSAQSVVASNPIENQNQYSIWANMYNIVGIVWLSGAFTGNGYILDSVTFEMTNYYQYDFSNPSPTGAVRPIIVNATSPYQVLDYGEIVDVSTIIWSTTLTYAHFTLVNFSFNGSYQLINGQNYFVGLEITTALNNVLACGSTYNVWAGIGYIDMNGNIQSAPPLGYSGQGSEYAPIYYVYGSPMSTPTPIITRTPTSNSWVGTLINSSYLLWIMIIGFIIIITIYIVKLIRGH